MKKLTIRELTMCALFAALTAVLSQIAIPIGPVPINLATFAVLLCGGLLGAKLGALSMICWIALGAMGVPVFSNLQGGVARLVGPTGGYIIGYVAGAMVTGLMVKVLGEGKFWRYCIAMLCGAATYFVLGTIWFVHLTGNTLSQALGLCVYPFLPGDALKILLAAFLAVRLLPIMRQS